MEFRWIFKSCMSSPSNLDFKHIKLPLKVTDIHKIEKKSSISISVFGYENKEKTSNLSIKKML